MRPTLALIAGGLLLSACAVPPPPGPAAPSARPDAASHDEYARERARLERLAVTRAHEHRRRVERVGSRLLATMPDPPRVQFVVLDGDPSINAGATFGQVGITSGMLNFLRSDDEVAVVLGHELAHITHGHVMQGLLGGLALNVLAVVVESQAPGTGRAVGGIGQLFLNRYTQTQEREADDVGLRYTYGAGYDPRASQAIQERMAVEVPQSMSAGFFDTHPSSVERAVNARRLAEALLAGGPPPGRETALALARADAAAEPDGPEARGPDGREPDADTAPGGEPQPPHAFRARDASDAAVARGPGCRRARVYLAMGDDARGTVAKRRLYRRALRYCPGLAAARARLDDLERTRGADPAAP